LYDKLKIIFAIFEEERNDLNEYGIKLTLEFVTNMERFSKGNTELKRKRNDERIQTQIEALLIKLNNNYTNIKINN